MLEKLDRLRTFNLRRPPIRRDRRAPTRHAVAIPGALDFRLRRHTMRNRHCFVAAGASRAIIA